MEKMLNSAMVEEELTKKVARKNEIADLVEERKASFETADVESRDAFLNEIEDLTKEADELDVEIKELEEERNKYAEQEERMSMTKNVSKTAVEERKEQIENTVDSKEYNQLYADFIRGKVQEAEIRSYAEKRALATSTTGVPIPQIMQGFVETAWYEYGKFSRLVSETFEPAILRIPVETAADGANWHKEGTSAPNEESITLGQIILQPKMIKKWIECMAIA